MVVTHPFPQEERIEKALGAKGIRKEKEWVERRDIEEINITRMDEGYLWNRNELKLNIDCLSFTGLSLRYIFVKFDYWKRVETYEWVERADIEEIVITRLVQEVSIFF